jgi:hypothetical protein
MAEPQTITAKVTPGFLVQLDDRPMVFIPLNAEGATQPALDLRPFELYLSNVAVLPFDVTIAPEDD